MKSKLLKWFHSEPVAAVGRCAVRHRKARHLLQVTQQFRKGNPEANRQHFEDAQTCLSAPILQLGDVDAANP